MYKRYSPPQNLKNGGVGNSKNNTPHNRQVSQSRIDNADLNSGISRSEKICVNDNKNCKNVNDKGVSERKGEEKKRVDNSLNNSLNMQCNIGCRRENCERCRMKNNRDRQTDIMCKTPCGEKCDRENNKTVTNKSCTETVNPRESNNAVGNLREIIHSVLGMLPSSVYDNKSKKFFGIIGTEDLLLIMLIFLLAENENDSENLLVYALLYLLVSDYIDIPF